MKYFNLPLTPAQLDELNLPSKVAHPIRIAEEKVDELVVSGWLLDESILKEITWFLNCLERNTTIISIAGKSEGLFWVLKSKETKCQGRIYLPICLVEEDGMDLSSAVQVPVTAVLRVLRRSFSDIDREFRFFSFAGASASDFADFSRDDARLSQEEWGNSMVFYCSLGGDSLFLGKDESVAWHQLETNQIFPAGKFNDEIVRYLKSALEDNEFTSWTDAPEK